MSLVAAITFYLDAFLKKKKIKYKITSTIHPVAFVSSFSQCALGLFLY